MNRHWLARPGALRALWWLLVIALLLSLGAEFLVEDHSPFGLAGGVSFYAWFGFLACVALILVAKLLALLIKRDDSYYDGH